jgi:hypothetical protein
MDECKLLLLIKNQTATVPIPFQIYTFFWKKTVGQTVFFGEIRAAAGGSATRAAAEKTATSAE